MNDTSKLPKWAQWEIKNARERAIAAEQALDALLGKTETAIEIDRYSREIGQRYLPDRTCISFKVKGGCIEARIEGDRLLIMGYNNEGELNVRPVASNVVRIGYEVESK